MSSRLVRALGVICVLATALGAPPALAQDRELRISTAEWGGWPETVAALQADVRAEGRSVHVTVFDASSQVAPCGSYALALDASGARAFTVGACDPRTQATELVLRARTELFSHDGLVPTPRAIRLTATEVRFGDVAGGAAVTGGAALDCSVGIRPYLDDLEHGGVVYLGPDLYEVRPTDTTVLVSVEPHGWSLHARASAAMTIGYDVVDRTSQVTVFHDSATLACGTSPATAPPPAGSTSRTPLARTVETPEIEARAAHVLVLQTTDLPRAAEVVMPLDIHEPVGDEAHALQLLRERAAALGADAVIGVEFHHGHGGGPIHLSGLAVRFVDLSHG